MRRTLLERIKSLEAIRCVFKSLLNAKIIDENQYQACIRKATGELAPELCCLFERT